MLITEYRLELAIQALRAILPLAHPADTTLRYFFKDERIGSNERELVAETVFGVLRNRLLLEHACGESHTPRRMALAWLVRLGGYNLREVETVFGNQHEKSGFSDSGAQFSRVAGAARPKYIGISAYRLFRVSVVCSGRFA